MSSVCENVKVAKIYRRMLAEFEKLPFYDQESESVAYQAHLCCPGTSASNFGKTWCQLWKYLINHYWIFIINTNKKVAPSMMSYSPMATPGSTLSRFGREVPRELVNSIDLQTFIMYSCRILWDVGPLGNSYHMTPCLKLGRWSTQLVLDSCFSLMCCTTSHSSCNARETGGNEIDNT